MNFLKAFIVSCLLLIQPAFAGMEVPGAQEIDGTWTPSDASGAGLTFITATGFYRKIGRTVYIFGFVTYPSTASAVQAKLGSLPFTPSASGTNQNGAISVLANTSVNTQFVVTVGANTMAAANMSANAAVNNSVFSTLNVPFFGTYPTDQ